MVLLAEGAVRCGTTTRAGLEEGLTGRLGFFTSGAFFGSGLLTGGLLLTLDGEDILGLDCRAGAGDGFGAGAGAVAGADTDAGARTGELATTLGLDGFTGAGFFSGGLTLTLAGEGGLVLTLAGEGATLLGTIAFTGRDGVAGLADGAELLRIGVNICLRAVLVLVLAGGELLLPGIIVVM
jgi:hypothetical protein